MRSWLRMRRLRFRWWRLGMSREDRDNLERMMRDIAAVYEQEPSRWRMPVLP